MNAEEIKFAEMRQSRDDWRNAAVRQSTRFECISRMIFDYYPDRHDSAQQSDINFLAWKKHWDDEADRVMAKLATA